VYANVRPLRSLLLAAALTDPFGAAAGAATITVDTDLDADAADGVCSLREAILAANTDAVHNECPAGNGADHIRFELSSPASILLNDHLPAITESLAIHGSGTGNLTLDGLDLYRAITIESPSNGISLVVQDLTLEDGRTRFADFGGGGAYIGGGASALFERVAFVSNSSANSGGGMMVGSGGVGGQSRVTLVECIFRENVADGPTGGGGLSTTGTGTGSVVTILRSVFADNHATEGPGGAIFGGAGFITIEASTISGNSAEGNGGGIHSSTMPQGGAALLVRDTTITDNTAGTGGTIGTAGGLYLRSPGPDFPLTVSLENSVVAGNFDLVGIDQPDVLCSNLTGLAATGSTLIGANDGCDAFFPEGFPNANGDFVGTVAAPIDPLLQPLANHGGSTHVHRPSVNPLSPLIDQGTCPDAITDQRLYGDPASGLRLVDIPQVDNASGGDGCDIGAFEVGADPLFDDLIFADGFELGTSLRWDLAAGD
jgi:CSLREA domain-containing protein